MPTFISSLRCPLPFCCWASILHTPKTRMFWVGFLLVWFCSWLLTCNNESLDTKLSLICPVTITRKPVPKGNVYAHNKLNQRLNDKKF